MTEADDRDQDEITLTVVVPLDPRQAFDRFVALRAWWPKAYTWSGEALVDLRIDARVDGLLTEIGPHFARHGGDVARYRDTMASDMGWPYLLRTFAASASQ
jgi:hypothetical protein